jgi:hypothetical protein
MWQHFAGDDTDVAGLGPRGNRSLDYLSGRTEMTTVKIRPRNRLLLYLVLPVSVLACGCVTRVPDIHAKPSDYQLPVIVRGKVTVKGTIPLTKVRGYVIDDGSGWIGVATTKPLPAERDVLIVAARVETLEILTQRIAYLREYVHLRLR